jgi:hypothetical protein
MSPAYRNTTDNRIEEIENQALETVSENFKEFADGDTDILQSLIATLMTKISCRAVRSFPSDICQIEIILAPSDPKFEDVLEEADEKVDQTFKDYAGGNEKILRDLRVRFVSLLTQALLFGH